MTSIGTANLQALAARGMRLPSGSAEPDTVRVLDSPRGSTLLARTPNGREVRLHSDRDPLREAHHLLDGVCAEGEPDLLVVIGLGLGYFLDALEQRSARTSVLALEPLPRTLPFLLDRRDWRAWIESGRLTILTGPDYPGSTDAWKLMKGGAPSPPIIVHPVIGREFPGETAAARRTADQIVFGAQANEKARVNFAGPYLLNTLRNLATIAAESDVSALDDLCPGAPAIVVAAGPSLDRMIEELRASDGRAVIIAVDTALRPLLTAGVRPHVVVAVDPSEINGTHLQNLPNPDGIWLVAEGSMQPGVFTRFRGRTFTFRVSDHHPWPWFARHGIGRGTLKAWGSVLTSAFDLSLRMGCNPIIFAGADLAYSEGRPYCRGTTFEAAWARRTARGLSLPEVWQAAIATRAPVEAEDVNGRPVMTTANLIAFRTWLIEHMRSYPDRRFVNATPGGILFGAAIEQAPLHDILCTPPKPGELPAGPALALAWRRGVTPDPARRIRSAQSDVGKCRNELLSAWRQFSLGTLDDARILAALESGSAMVVDPPRQEVEPQATPPESRGSGAGLRQPEQMALLRAVLSHEPWPDWIQAPADSAFEAQSRGEAVEDRLDRSLRLLFRLAGREPLLTGEPPSPTVKADRLPALARFPWHPAMVDEVSAFAQLLGEAIWFVGPEPCPSAAQSFWNRSTGNAESAPGGDGELIPEQLQRAARVGQMALLALFREWICTAQRCCEVVRDPSWRAWISGASARLERLIDGSLASLRDARPRSGNENCRLALVGVTNGTAVPGAESLARGFTVRADHLQGAATGVVVRPADDGVVAGECESREAPAEFNVIPLLPPRFTLALRTTDGVEIGAFWLVEPEERGGGGRGRGVEVVMTIDPFVLAECGMPPAGNPAIVDHQTVIVAGRYQRDSWHVHESGGFSLAHHWPAPILGELPWGPDGGAIAWDSGRADAAHLTEPCVWFRERLNTAPRRFALPFRPNRGMLLPDGRVAWNCRDGGIGTWSPAAGPALHCADNFYLGLVLTARGVQVMQVRPPTGAGSLSRWTTARCWVWDTVSDTLQVGPPHDTTGPASSSSTHGHWTAATHTLSGVVRLTNSAGTVFHLICAEPLHLAWAGGTLVVATVGGDVLVFRNLAETLDAASGL